MARRRKTTKMYKDLSFVQVDDLGSGGSPTPIAKITKQQGQMSSAYIKNIRVHCILNDIAGGATPASDMPLNFMWYATTTDSANPDDDNVIAAAATSYGGGTVNLSINCLIRDNDYDANSGTGAVCIWCEATDATVTANIEMKCVLESYGRWHNVLTE